MDFLVVLSTTALVMMASRFVMGAQGGFGSLLLERAVGFALLYSCLALLSSHFFGLHDSHAGAVDQSLAYVLKAVSLATVLVLGIIAVSGRWPDWWYTAFICAAASGTGMIGWRVVAKFVAQQKVKSGCARNAIIVGTGEVARELSTFLQRNPVLGYCVRGFVADDGSIGGKVLGTVADLGRICKSEFVDEVFVTSASKPELVSAIVAEATRQQVAVTLVPELYGGVACCAPLEYLGDLPVLCVYQQPTLLVPRLIKRAMDVVLASAALIVSAPVFAMVAAAIKVDSPGPVFYRHKRVGAKARRFTLYKFRTMCAGADEKKPMLAPLNQRVGLLFKIAHDPRVTRIGRYLRKYSVDELPQLWNVLKGDMSLVGPRPPSVDEVEYYQIEHLIRLTVPPGITGLWQVSARQDPSFERAVALDAEYIRSWSPWLDLKLLVRTIPAVLKGTGC